MCTNDHHLEIKTQECKWKQLSAIIHLEYMKGQKGSVGGGGGGASPLPQKPTE